MDIRNLCIWFLLLLLTACSSGSSSGPPAQGDRILGMDVKEIPSVPYTTAYNQAMQLGAREVSVALDWQMIEPTVGNYNDTLPDIIESFYYRQTGDLTLVLRPLDTPGPRLPADLAGASFDDPAVISAFRNFLIHLHSRLATLNASGKLRWIHVGNEIDAYLGTNATRWSQWNTFLQAAKAQIESLWGTDMVVGSIIQFSALEDAGKRAFYLNMLPGLDSAVLTYYPLNADFSVRPVSSIGADFDLLTSSIPGKPILLQECGYPSSTVNSSSESQQANFISAVFDAWDEHRARIALIDFTWQYDVSDATADQWVIDYGMAGNPYENPFREYLRSLGFSHYDSSEKPALQTLRDELRARVWAQ